MKIGTWVYIALFSSTSRFERNIGQVRVLGLNNVISVAESEKCRSSSRRSDILQTKKMKSAFSKLLTLTKVCDSMRSRKKYLVVSSVTIPEGTMHPTLPLGVIMCRIASANIV